MDRLNKEIDHDLKTTLDKEQKKFIETDLFKTINFALDVGIKSALPDLIEDQVINIKNTIIEQGFSKGVKEVLNTGIDYGKSAIGIVNGDFENISQMQMAIKKGGIIDNVSKLLDLSINLAKSKNLISLDLANMLKKGKNTIVSSISNKIEERFTSQIKAIEKLENYCNKWNTAYNNKNFSEMEKAYKNISSNLKKIVPFENIINEARKIENIHNLIKNNGNNFELSEEEKLLAVKI